jgi:hypothetical protein
MGARGDGGHQRMAASHVPYVDVHHGRARPKIPRVFSHAGAVFGVSTTVARARKKDVGCFPAPAPFSYVGDCAIRWFHSLAVAPYVGFIR